jgi:CheY-like chemotaxis protein/anti-sigma regulatory factor (Ser/Thr protein kinase)
MNGVVGLAKLMLRTQLTESQQGYARAISESGESLVGIINDILDFSKIEAGKMDLESEDFDLCELIEDVATLCGPRAHEAGVDLVVDVPTAPVIATGDTLRVRQIVSNLLGNALKFTPEGTVAVALSVAGNGVSIEVRDTGIGISEDRLESIFATFTQADSSSSRRFGGTGLGLTIARQLAQKMGGDIEVSSEVGKGSTFRVFLALTTQVSGVSGPILEGTRVGICCPHPDIARVVSGHIRNWGGTPVFAEKLSDLDTDVALIAASELAKLKEVPISKVIAVASPIQAVPSLPYQKLLIKPVRRGELAHALAPTAGFGRSRHTVTPVDAKPLEGRHILLAEDNSVNQLLATALLEDWGATVDLAEDGVETVEKVTAGAYDAVLMDCQMPRLSGFEATQQIRKLGTVTSTVPIIALTANAMESDRQRCLAAGMDAYISKPLDADQLLQELLSLVSPEQPSQP